MNKEFKQYYDSCEYGDIIVESSDKKRKKLHKLVLSNNSKYLQELVRDKEEIIIDYKWKYLEPILKFIYMDQFSFNYHNLSKDTNHTIQEFETILHIAIHFSLDSKLIQVIIDHFDYKKRLQNDTMKELCLLLKSLYKISQCSNIDNNIDIIANLANTIILYNLMNIDPYLTVIGDEFSIVISNQLYNNLIRIWYLDNISSVTINEVITYYIKKIIEYNIPLELLYKLSKQEIYIPAAIDFFPCNNQSTITIDDIKKLNNIIVNNIIEFVLNEPNYQFKNVYHLLCVDEPMSIIDKLVDFKDTNILLDIKIEDLTKKTLCQVCCDSNVDCCLKGCGHLFCRDCVSELMIQNRTNSLNYTQCPLCKKDFTKYDLVTIYI